MAETLDMVAQQAMDLYYQQFKSQTDFFELSDFVSYGGSMVADLYLQMYREGYAEIRSEKSPQIVGFPYDWLVNEVLEVKDNKTLIPKGVMSFYKDNNTVGLQNVLAVKPSSVKIERSNQDEIFQYDYMPFTSRVFYYTKRVSDGLEIHFKSKNSNLSTVEVYYIPTISDSMPVPEGIVNQIIMNLPLRMKQISQGAVIDTTNDGNPNKIVQTEVNKVTLK